MTSFYSRPVTTRGFTFIEIMTVVAIMGIIATVAWSYYEGQLKTMRHKDAVNALTTASHIMELCKSDAGNYTNCTIITAPAHSPYGLYTYNTSGTATSISSQDGHYNITLTINSADSYTLTATKTPVDDAEYKTLTIDNLGQEGSTGSASFHHSWGD